MNTYARSQSALMLPKPSPDALPLSNAAAIVASLDGISTAANVEADLLNHGDDIFDVVIGMREIVRNRRLFGCLPVPVKAWSGDTVAIGSGPSLDADIPALRQLQDTVVLIAAHSAIPKLLEHGIIPHIITPKERDPSCGLVPSDLPSSVIYSGLACVPEAPDRCARHWLVRNQDAFMSWLGHGGYIHAPLTSGTLAACIGAEISNSVYLVGFDMTMGHYDGYDLPEETAGGSVSCVDGVVRPSCLLYQRARNELSSLADECVMVQCATQGASIAGNFAMAGKLPSPGSKRVWLPTESPSSAASEQSVARASSRIAMIPGIMAEAELRLAHATKLDDISSSGLFGEHHVFGSALFQTVYLSTSILRRTQSLSDAECFDFIKCAIGNAMDCLRGIWKDMANDCA